MNKKKHFDLYKEMFFERNKKKFDEIREKKKKKKEIKKKMNLKIDFFFLRFFF